MASFQDRAQHTIAQLDKEVSLCVCVIFFLHEPGPKRPVLGNPYVKNTWQIDFCISVDFSRA